MIFFFHISNENQQHTHIVTGKGGVLLQLCLVCGYLIHHLFIFVSLPLTSDISSDYCNIREITGDKLAFQPLSSSLCLLGLLTEVC